MSRGWKRLTHLLLAGMTISSLACSGARTSMNLPLTWKPTDDVRDVELTLIDALSQQRVKVYPFTDRRSTPSLIGRNTQDGGQKPVTTPDDVGQYVGNRFAYSLREI